MALAFGVSKVDMLSPVRLVRSFDHCLTLFSEVTLGSGAALTVAKDVAVDAASNVNYHNEKKKKKERNRISS